MRNYITGVDIANTVRMTHRSNPVTCFLVEGQSDLYCFTQFVHPERCEIFQCHGRKNVEDALHDLNDTEEPGVLGLIDSDFDRINAIPEQMHNCNRD